MVSPGSWHPSVDKTPQFPPLLVGQHYVHYGSIANPLKIVNISFCSLLLVDPLKFQEHIGINAWARFDIQEKCAQFERQNRSIPMIPRQLKNL